MGLLCQELFSENGIFFEAKVFYKGGKIFWDGSFSALKKVKKRSA